MSQKSAVQLVLVYLAVLVIMVALMFLSDLMSPAFRNNFAEIIGDGFRIALGAVIGTLPFAFAKA